jgi:hypothetical protein
MAIDTVAKRVSVLGHGAPWYPIVWPDGTKSVGWRASVTSVYAGVGAEVAPPVVGGTGDAYLASTSGVAGLRPASGTANLIPVAGVACLRGTEGEAQLHRSSAAIGWLSPSEGVATLKTSTAVAGLHPTTGGADLARSSGVAGLRRTEGDAVLKASTIQAATGFTGKQRAQEAEAP